MIARVRGRLVEKAPEQIVVDVGGVGYQIFVSLQCFYRLPELGGEVEVFVHTHVREDALQLFGFLDPAERALFLMLISIATIGPRAALAVLSGLDVADLEQALADGDTRRLTAVPGIGKKKADLMVLQLRDKVIAHRNLRQATPARRGGDGAEAVSALVNLGYKQAEAERAVKNVEQASHSVALPDLIREALRRLAS